MSFQNYDLYFPNLHIGIEHLVNHISIFGFPIAFYGMIIGCGMLLGLFVATKEYVRSGYKADDIQDFALWVIVLGIIGARIYYVIFEWDYYSKHLLEIPNIRQGGLAIYGGVLMALFTCIVYTRKKKLDFFPMADAGVLGLILGQAIGRWGNFFNAEAFGGYTDSLLAMRIKESIVNPAMINENVRSHILLLDDISYIQVHPTFLYESVWNLCVFFFLLWFSKRKKFKGQVFLLYLGLYGFGRFFIEGLRADSLMLFGTGIAVSQALSLVLVLASVILQIFFLKKNSSAEQEDEKE
ncbi:MAG: prolipoprotein diacylglyceryl transferase [Lachnospiraceae bacterium]|jgi:prolipoprotein diacylglyceryl transferase|nr:prolipoprotein diacylglyceryl transferase [Lachnospiraceae bacterium]